MRGKFQNFESYMVFKVISIKTSDFQEFSGYKIRKQPKKMINMHIKAVNNV